MVRWCGLEYTGEEIKEREILSTFPFICLKTKVVSEIVALQLKAKNTDFPLCFKEQSNEAHFQLWVQLFLTKHKKGEAL